MSEKDLKESVGQAGITEFSMNNDTARLFLDIHIETRATIGTFSAGNPADWDLQFVEVEVGNSINDPLIIDGLVFVADFDNSSNLERVVIGSNRIQGNISAIMNMYSGVYNDSLTGGSGSPVNLLDGAAVGAPGRTTFQFDSTLNDMGMFLVLTTESDRVGFQLVSGYTENSIITNDWWDAP